MALDPNIPLSGHAPKFNNPFDVLAQGQDRRAQQAAQQQDAQIREQQLQRGDRQLAAEDAAAGEAADYKQIIGNPDLTPESFLEQVRLKVPGKYDAAVKRNQDIDAAAMALQSDKLKLADQTKAWVGGMLTDVVNADYDLATTEVLLKKIETHVPDFAPEAAKIRAQILEGGPEALKRIVSGMLPKAPIKEGFTLSADQTRYGPEGQVLAQAPSKPTPEPASIEAMIVAATRAKDGPEVRRLLNLKGQLNAAGRAPAETKEPSKMWVMRDGQAVRASEGEIRPGDQPASTREQGRPVTSGDAGRLAELDTSISDLEVLATTLGTTGAQSKIGASVPNFITEATGWGADAKSRQATIDRVKQVIGKALEGGVLRKEDEIKYEKILPTIGDPPSVAKTKLTGLATALSKRKQTTIDALADAGYDTTKFTGRTGAGAAGAAGAKKIGRFEIID